MAPNKIRKIKEYGISSHGEEERKIHHIHGIPKEIR
jgi:hypothetical protein